MLEDFNKLPKRVSRSTLKTMSSPSEELEEMRVKATHEKTGDSVIFDSLRDALEVIGGGCEFVTEYLASEESFFGFIFRLIDPEE